MNSPEQTSPRQRLQQLLSIPERQRTDAEWDEINELEIELAPGNREMPQDRENRRPTPSAAIFGKPGGAGGGGGQGKKPFKKPNKRQPRRNPR